MLVRASRSGATATRIDAAIAGAATVGVQQAVWSGQIAGRSVLLAALFLPATVALFWRRRAPSAFLVLFFGAFAIQGASTGDAPEGAEFVLPILVGLYSLGAYGSRREALVAWPFVVVGTAVHDLNDVAFSDDPWAGAFWWLVSVAAYGIGVILRARRQATALEAQTERAQAERADAARAAVAEERGRIARELHDAIAHSVSVTAIHAEAAEAVLPSKDSAQARASLQRIQASSREALTEMRRLLGLLRDDDGQGELTPQPGVADLERLAEQITAAGLPVELCADPRAVPLPPGIDISAYRIVQEALTNSLKHGASRARVELRCDPSSLVIEVRDRPAAPADPRSDAPLTGGHGLIGMQERVAFFGGDFTAGPCDDGGFSVRARFPLAESTLT